MVVSKRVQKTVLKSSYNLRPRPTCNKHSSLVSHDAPKCTLRPHTRNRKSIPYLTPDIIFAILVYLPADILYNVVRYVCREWYDIISTPQFIDAHLLKAERGLLIKQQLGYCINYVEMEKNDALQMVQLGFSYFKPHYGISCCNGLVFLCDQKNRHVVNYVTKEVITLSPPPNFKSNIQFHSMGYTRSKKYKLIEFYTIRNTNRKLVTVAGILTLGVDTEWRSLFQLIHGTGIDHFDWYEFTFNKPIVSAQGILHVVHKDLPLVFNLDLETETFYTRAIPECSKISRTYMGTGRSLCFMDYLGNFSWELWLLKDAEAGEWTKQAIIDLGGQKETLWRILSPREFDLVPVGFLKDGEIVVFNVKYENEHDPSRDCIAYNVKTGGINSFYLDNWGSTDQMDRVWMYNTHVKSLVSPKF